MQHETARTWAAEKLQNLNTWGYATPSGGRHWFFQQPKIGPAASSGQPARVPGGGLIRSNQNLLADNVDVRGHNGYVILWGALGYPHFGKNVAPCPDWLAEELRRKKDPRPRRVTEPPAETVSEAIMALRAEIVRGIKNDSRFDSHHGSGCWISMLGAIQHGFSGDLELGYKLWIDFCDRRENKDIDSKIDEETWVNFQGPPKATFGSIVKWAKEQGDLTEELAAYRTAMNAKDATGIAQDMPLHTGPAPEGDAEENDTSTNDEDNPPANGTQTPGLWMPNTYALDEKGLYYDGKRLMGAFRILGEARDANSSGWGLWLEWHDNDGVLHDWVMPRSTIASDWTQTVSYLLSEGLYIRQGEKAATPIKNFFGLVRAPQRIETVPETGWHQAKTGQNMFIWPNGTILGLPDRQLARYTGPNSVSKMFSPRGTLAEWQNAIATPAIGNDLFILALCSEFAANLLHVTGDTGTILHLVGPTQRGKTTLLCAAGSIYGLGAVSNGVAMTWHTTDNGLEGKAHLYCDHVILLDELDNAKKGQSGNVASLLVTGKGKTRMTKALGVQRDMNWRAMGLSSGNVTLQQKLRADGEHHFAEGLHVRMLNIPLPPGGHGVFQNLHDWADGKSMSIALRDAAGGFYGTAGPAFLNKLIPTLGDSRAALQDWIALQRAVFEKAALPVECDAHKQAIVRDSEVQSAARRFSLLAAAGELASHYGVLPWPSGEACRGILACFHLWQGQRGGLDSSVSAEIAQRLKMFLAKYGISRFALSKGEPQHVGLVDDHRSVVARAGYRSAVTIKAPSTAKGPQTGLYATVDRVIGMTYYILDSVFEREIFPEFSLNDVIAALTEKKMLLPKIEKTKTRAKFNRQFGQDGSMTVYRISHTVLEEENSPSGNDSNSPESP